MRLVYVPMFFTLLLSVCCPVLAHDNPPTDFLITPEQIVKVYDGDTFYVNLPYLPSVFGEELPIRARTFDTPEMRSRCESDQAKEQEKALALKAKERVEEILYSATLIRLNYPEKGSFFRVVATVTVDGDSLGDILISEGLAIAYEDRDSMSWCALSM